MFENFHWAAKYRRLYGGLYVKPPGRVVAERTLALGIQYCGRLRGLVVYWGIWANASLVAVARFPEGP